MKPYYIFTGGPGSGKSTVLQALAHLNYPIVPEVGRAIIQQQMHTAGDALPWLNKQRFFEAMFNQSVHDYQSHPAETPLFFDRGLLDSIGYARLEHLEIQPTQLNVAKQMLYASPVFIFPPWESIYVNDQERKQDFTLAIQTYEVMYTTYKEFGYQLVEVPCTSIEERVEFILEYLHLKP